MMDSHRTCNLAMQCCLGGLCVVLQIHNGLAYVPADPWSVTASGSVTTEGTPITLTWSIAPDGSNIPGEGSNNLVAYLDDLFNVTTADSNFSNRPWFALFEQSFDRWSELGGINFVYEAHDNGAQLQSSRGILGVRGDIRISGAYVDGASNTLAYTWLPDSGDIVIDTGETNFYSNSANDYRQLRDTLMHEIGHAFGLSHVISSTESLLMEPYIDTSIDGPQLDDIRGIQGLYGDYYEKSNDGLGNGTYDLATSLGYLNVGGSLEIGSDASTGQSVLPSETDFVSIANSSDTDFFSFSTSTAGVLDVTLTPLGGVFNQGVEGGVQSSFNANARNNLSLAVFGPDGTTLLGLAEDASAGVAESLDGLSLSSPSEYYVRVLGDSDSVQPYELDLSLAQALNVFEGDYNSDGVVDGKDFLVWQQSYGLTGMDLAADGNGNGRIDQADLSVWQANFGTTAVTTATVRVPEPTSEAVILVMGLVLTSGLRCRAKGLKGRKGEDKFARSASLLPSALSPLRPFK